MQTFNNKDEIPTDGFVFSRHALDRLKDITGLTQGYIEVVGLSHMEGNRVYWRIFCHGCNQYSSLRYNYIVSKKFMSCGCLHYALVAKSLTKRDPKNIREYRSWFGMKARCYNPKSKKYYRYGARGITVCDRWLASFDDFLSDVGKCPSSKHSLERVNNDKGYYPENVIWATADVQARNRRTNIRLTYNGETKVLKDWANQVNINHATIKYRLDKGWDIEKALTTPVRKHK